MDLLLYEIDTARRREPIRELNSSTEIPRLIPHLQNQGLQAYHTIFKDIQ